MGDATTALHLLAFATFVALALGWIASQRRLKETERQLAAERQRCAEFEQQAITYSQSEERLRLLIDAVPGMIAYRDQTEHYRLCNKAYLATFAADGRQVIGLTTRTVIGERAYADVQPDYAQTLSGKTVIREREHTWPDGNTSYFVNSYVPHVADDGKVIGFYTLIVDITERKRVEQALRDSESRLSTVADGLPALISYIDSQQIYRFANHAYEDWLGIKREDIIGHSKRELLGEEVYRIAKPSIDRVFEGWAVAYERTGIRNGAICHLHCDYVPHFDEQNRVLGFFALLTDVSDQKLLEHKLAHMAQHDALTGLPNRVLFEEQLALSIERYKRHAHAFALMYLDVDHFKSINDVHGHRAGDHVLKAFATRISACIRASDIAARLGGDEFVIVLEGLTDPEHATQVAQKIVTAMQAPIQLEQTVVQITTSIGIAIPGNPEIGASDLIAQADAALYQAKALGRNTFHIGI